MKELKRVVVTGCGVVSALGNQPDMLFENLAQGKSAARYMPEWQEWFSDIPVAAPINFDEVEYRAIERKFRRSMGHVAIYATLAAKQALSSSGLDDNIVTSGEVGCSIGSTMGGSREIEESVNIWNSSERDLMPATQFFKCVSHTCALNVANYLGIKGRQLAPCSACSSALQAIGMAYETIQSGRQIAMLAGGADELTPMVSGSFSLLFAQAKDESLPPHAISRPFDQARSGLICGEGAGVLLLEEYEHAMARKAPIIFEIIGFATNSSAVHISQSDHNSVAGCMRQALDDANVSASEVDYVNAHATGTPQGDLQEAIAISEIFGDKVAVSSLKGHLGHTLGASGGIELVALAEMLKREQIVPTLNLDTPDEALPALHHVRGMIEKNIEIFVKNSFAFGGINATIVGRKLIYKG